MPKFNQKPKHIFNFKHANNFTEANKQQNELKIKHIFKYCLL